jgi:hypothetical protein
VSTDENTDNDAWNYMYMWSLTEHRYKGFVQAYCFEHIMTREYMNVDAKKSD